MDKPRNHTTATRVVTAFEHLRRTGEAISKQQKRSFRESYDQQFKELAAAGEALEVNWQDLEA